MKPDEAAKRLLEIANGVDASDGKIDVGQVNSIFLRKGGSPAEYRAGMMQLRADFPIEMHPSDTYSTFTRAGRAAVCLNTTSADFGFGCCAT